MKKQLHTRGPWAQKQYPKCYGIVANSGRQIAIMTEHHGDCPMVPMTQFDRSEQDAADAARIVACVNACEGIADPEALINLVKMISIKGTIPDFIADELKQLLSGSPEPDWKK